MMVLISPRPKGFPARRRDHDPLSYREKADRARRDGALGLARRWDTMADLLEGPADPERAAIEQVRRLLSA